MNAAKTRLGHTVLLAISSIIVLSGCGNTLQPSGTVAVNVIDAPSATTVNEVTINVRYVVENSGSTPIHYRPCLTVIERSVGADWRGVWGRLCSGVTEVTIGANSSRADTMVVHFSRQPGQPDWEYGPIGGAYRVRVSVADLKGAELPEGLRSSNVFLLREGGS